MKFEIKAIFSSIICILSIYIVLMTSIDTIAFHRSFYDWQYDNLHTAENIGMSKEDLYVATDTLLDYLKGYRDSISVQVEVHDEMREVFTTREKKHMVDVKNLYQDAITLRNVCAVVVLLLFALLYYDNKKNLKEVLTYSYIRVFVLFLFALCALLVYAYCDFTTFWNTFHTLFFSNDLWLLNPNTSIMINMFPQPFFYAMVFSIGALFFGVLTLLFAYSVRVRRKWVKGIQ